MVISSQITFILEGGEDILKLFFKPNSPILLSIIIIALIAALLYYFYRYLLAPAVLKVNKEKENLELKHTKMMALFAELDPDPIIRINNNGDIIQTNEAAEKAFNCQLKGKKLHEVLPIKQEQIYDAMTNNNSATFTEKIGNKYYTILLRGEPLLQFAQVYFRDITQRKKYEEMLVKSEKRLRDLSERSNELIEEERQRIARELHDGIGQNLSFLKLKMSKLLEEKTAAAGREDLQNLIELLELTITELKEISYKLKPRVLEEMGLIPALKHLIEKTTRESNIKGSYNVTGLNKRLDFNLEIYIYRIIQESLNNIIKHSNATEFNIQIVLELNLIRIMISDNGKGFDAAKALNNNGKLKGMGLINIQERIKNYDGKFKVESEIGKGTVLIIEIPLAFKNKWKAKIK